MLTTLRFYTVFSWVVAISLVFWGKQAVGTENPAHFSRRAILIDNPIVYFVITDRFHNGDLSNDRSYGRMPDGQQEIGTFHGGDLKGLTAKLQEGWFQALGVNAIWITAPYEQIHGWVVGGDKAFKHYAYHGYYALDYTVLDKNMGSPEDLQILVKTAHSQGIRIIMDVVLNHPGYADLQSLSDLQISVLWPGWEKATLKDYHSFINYNSEKWRDWWGPSWVRAGLRGYQEGGQDEFTKQLAYLPDFKTESTGVVSLPPWLAHKTGTHAQPIPQASVRDYLIRWLTDWVRQYGIDGFRVDTVKHVEPTAWPILKEKAKEALQAWQKEHPTEKLDDADFWMTGEYWGQGVQPGKLFEAGFDNLINFDFQQQLLQLPNFTEGLEPLYQKYAQVLATPATHNVLSYLSSHDTLLFPRQKLFGAAAALMLAPGGVHIFYGDETARPEGPSVPSDPQQATRSDMNWQKVDQELLMHWRKLGQFRTRHVALARGKHQKLQSKPYVFGRLYSGVQADRVVAVLGASGQTVVPVVPVFQEGELLWDAYSEQSVRVKKGAVALEAAPTGVILLELAPKQAKEFEPTALQEKPDKSNSPQEK